MLSNMFIPLLCCETTYKLITNGIIYFRIKKFVSIEMFKTHRVIVSPLIISLIHLWLLVSLTIDISPNSTNQSALKIIVLNFLTLQNFLKHLETITRQMSRVLLTLTGSNKTSQVGGKTTCNSNKALDTR